MLAQGNGPSTDQAINTAAAEAETLGEKAPGDSLQAFDPAALVALMGNAQMQPAAHAQGRLFNDGKTQPAARRAAMRPAIKALGDARAVGPGNAGTAIGDPEQHSSDIHPLSIDPIVEQVARITLPQNRR